ncbi:hypothetical protein [Bifidobacterium aquikefiri]|uniref:hypothetical protein n=1 Tax=Bifidobacterium aquikefiri TaxID=1653207 RepID=UPI0039EB54B8
MAKYIRNAAGGVQAVSDEHYSKYLTVKDEAGNEQPKPGYSVLTEKAARKENPQLFGETDPNVIYTMKELVTKRKYAENLAAFKAADAQANDDTASGVEAAPAEAKD